MTVRTPKGLEPADDVLGDKTPYSVKPRKCKIWKCKTMLNKYRIANGEKYCSLHQFVEMRKFDKEVFQTMMESTKARRKYR